MSDRVGGINISKWATASNHEEVVSSTFNKIKSILIAVENSPVLLEQAINDIIQSNPIVKQMGGSPITGKMVIETSAKYNVDPALVMAIAHVDSHYGTAGLGAKTKNPGNWGNDDAGNIKRFDTWEEGLEAIPRQLALYRSRQRDNYVEKKFVNTQPTYKKYLEGELPTFTISQEETPEVEETKPDNFIEPIFSIEDYLEGLKMEPTKKPTTPIKKQVVEIPGFVNISNISTSFKKKFQKGGSFRERLAKTTDPTPAEARELYESLYKEYLDKKKSKNVKEFQDKVRSKQTEFAQKYITPVVKTAASFTPAGPAIGLTDAYWALQDGNKAGAALMAGAEALPYGLKYASKGIKSLLKNKEVTKEVNKFVSEIDWAKWNADTLPIGKVDDITENLKHLGYAKNYYSKYGYSIPENLAEIAKDSKLTDETIQGLVNQHNTFVRGVSTNWDEIAKKNPEILRHLEGKGIDYINNPQAAAEYMSTHVPIQTGYGRAGLNENVFREGKDAIYTSNSIPTAEGYTYGDGYIVKVKRPTDFSSKNRIDWINSNKLDYFEDNLKTAPKEIKDKFLKLTEERYIKEIEPKYFDKNGNWKNGKVLQKELNYDNWVLEQEIRQELGLSVEKQHNLLKHEGSNKTNLNKILDEDTYPDLFIGKLDIQNKDFHLKNLDEITKTIGKKYNTIRFNLENKISDLPSDSQLREQLIQDINNTRINAIKEVKTEQLNYLKENFPKEINEVDRYAHYLHIGTPGQKLLEPIEAIRITPDIWKNKSRAHTNVFSKGLSAGSLIPFYLYSQSQNQNKNEQ